MKEYSEGDRPPILDLIKVDGPMNSPELAKKLGVNTTAARQQLAVLERAGLVSVRVERRKVGRPTHLYILTEKGEALFPQGYGPMAVTVLRLIREMDGEKKVEKIFERRMKELVPTYRARLAGKSLPEQFRELARIRDEEGYLACASGQTLQERHCPISAIAREFPQACKYEKLLFEAVLGRKLQRQEHIVSGGKSCDYRPVSG